jgi:hypothetical protein
MLPLILVAVGAYLIGDSVLEDGKSFAKGGITEHGMKEGDKIKGSFDNVVVVENDGKTFIVNLNTGKRWSKRAWFNANHGNNGILAKMKDGGMMANGGMIGDYEVGDFVKVFRYNDNENYDDFRDKKLKIVDKITIKDNHPAFDDALENQALYSFEDVETNEDIPFSLYDYELEYYANGGMMANGGKVKVGKTTFDNNFDVDDKDFESAIFAYYNTGSQDNLERISSRMKLINLQKKWGTDKNKEVMEYIKDKYKTIGIYAKGGEVDDKFKYMMLSRLQSDNEYYLGNGNRNEKHLWAGSVDGQISEMKKLWNEVKVKPEWLSMEEINEYEKEMKSNKIANGGMMAKGGFIIKYVDSSGNEKTRTDIYGKPEIFKTESAAKFKISHVPALREGIHKNIRIVPYMADGGMMAKGGDVQGKTSSKNQDEQRFAKPIGVRWKDKAVKKGVASNSDLAKSPSKKMQEKYPKLVYTENRSDKSDKNPSIKYKSI